MAQRIEPNSVFQEQQINPILLYSWRAQARTSLFLPLQARTSLFLPLEKEFYAKSIRFSKIKLLLSLVFTFIRSFLDFTFYVCSLYSYLLYLWKRYIKMKIFGNSLEVYWLTYMEILPWLFYHHAFSLSFFIRNWPFF